MKLGIRCFHPIYLAQAHSLSAALGIPILGDAVVDLFLDVGDEGLRLSLAQKNAPGSVCVDFSSNKVQFRRKGGQNELLGRAVGVGKKRNLKVVDATAGLGGDSFVLADLGCRVICLERFPVVHALLADGQARGSQSEDSWVREVCSRMQVLPADATSWLHNNVENAGQADVVYLDPMFSGRSKAARARKEMWLFQQLVGEDDDTEQLLAAALMHARHRVVVKRPLKATAICGPNPSHAIKGKAVRFDVYVNQKLED